MKIKKLQSGGMPPVFTTFTPVTVTNPYAGVDPMLTWLQQTAAVTNGGASASGKSSADGMPTMKDTMALLKDMEGLSSDASVVYSSLQESAAEAALFGGSEDLISSYYRNLNLVNKVNASKKAYDEAYKIVKENGGISEAAITSSGEVIVKDSNNNIRAISPTEYFKNKDKYKIQTNSNLLYSRAHDSNMAFQDSLLEVVQNGTSTQKIIQTINAVVQGLGSTSNSIEGYTAKQSQQIQSGIAALKRAAEENIESMPMDGLYKTGITEKSQKVQAKLAIEAIYASLPENQKTLLKLKTNGSEEGAKAMIASIVMGKTDETKEYKMDYQENLNPDGTKKTSSGTSSTGQSAIDKEVQTNPALQFFLGYGNKGVLTIQNKSGHAIQFNANNMPIMDKDNNPLPVGTLQQVGQGQFGGMLNLSQATMGDVRIAAGGLNNVIIEGGQIYSTELPIDLEAQRNGLTKPDTKFLQEIDAANQELKQMGINPSGANTLSAQDIQKINAVYEKHKLPVKYQANGELTARYARFAMVNATATEDAFEGDLTFGSGAMKVSDSRERKRFESNMRQAGNSKFSLDNGLAPWIGLDGDDLYKGTIFIPIYNNIWNAMATTNSKISPSTSLQIETEQQKTDFRINSGYKSPGSWTNQ